MTYGWIDIGNGRQVYRSLDERQFKRSDLPSPMIINDTMSEPVQSMVDGSWHTSKSGLRATYKPSGNREGKEYVEVGNDPARLRPRRRAKPDRTMIKETVEKAKARFKRGERVR